MPPQAYNIVPQPTQSATPTHDDSSKDAPPSNSSQSKRTRDRDREASQSSRARTNRLLGDYTLSKTLGAGSMGKVKLATHNITGEKVCG